MNFRKYSSIENTYRTKTINYIVECGYSSGIWVSSLKIHGANYSYWSDGDVVKKARKSGFLEGESFYGDSTFNYDQNILNMFNNLKKQGDFSTLTVYGEIYGGIYNHPNVEAIKNVKKVQKEVQYRPDVNFIVFDIRVDDILLDHYTVVELCDQFGFFHVPVLGMGSFYDLMKTPVVFPDPLGIMLGYPKLEDNDAEGWVLKPVMPEFFNNGSRVILKGKNPSFSEKNGGKKGKIHNTIIEMSKEGDYIKEELLLYINENRLRNVLSHGEICKITQKDFGKLLGLFSKDIFVDFLKDNKDKFDIIDKKEQITIKRIMNKTAGDIIRLNFLNIIDGEF